jgi:acetyl esterase/lipase
MGADRRRVRALLLAVFVPVLIIAGVLASAVLGQNGPRSDRPTPLPRPIPAAPPPAPTPSAQAPAPTVAAVPAPAPPAPPAVAEPRPEPAPQPEPGAEPGFAPDTRFVPAGAERIDVGSGPEAAAIFRSAGATDSPGPVVIFLHGWVAIDPERYGAWIAHLVDEGVTVIFPAYQSKPAYDTTTPLADLLAGVRAALAQVALAPGRLVVAGHSAGGALAADYAAVAADHGLPRPAAVFSVYPGRKLRHLDVPIPATDLAQIAPGTRVLALAGQRDTAVGSGTARRIAREAIRADATLRIVRDDDADEHSDPRHANRAAQQAFWAPLDALIAATRPANESAPGP